MTSESNFLLNHAVSCSSGRSAVFAPDTTSRYSTGAPLPMLDGKRLPILDSVRGVAILAVMLFHFTVMTADNSGLSHALCKIAVLGRCGVDLFFVLSGFLITGILYDARHAGGYFKTFYARRILRIFPLYYGLLVAVFFVLPLLRGHMPLSSPDLLATQPWFWTHTVNVGIIVHDSPAMDAYGHLWSLAVEEHFYLLWPLVVFYLSRKALLRMCVGIVAGSLILRIVLMALGDNQQVCYLLTPCRIDQLAIGGWVAVMGRGARGLTPLYRQARWIVPASFIALFAILMFRDRFHSPDHDDVLMPTIGYTVVAIGFAGSIVLSLAVLPHTMLGNAMFHPILRFVGRHSYALYILHPMIIMAVLHRSPGTRDNSLRYAFFFISSGVICLVISVTLAWMAWHAWEKHFLRMKTRFEYKPA